MTLAEASVDLAMRASRIEEAIRALNLTPAQVVEGLTFLRAKIVMQHMKQPDRATYIEGMSIADGAAWDFWFNYEVFQAAKEAKQ